MPNDAGPRRRSLRLPAYDYSRAGAYFITRNEKALERIRGSLAKKTATELDAAQKQAAQVNGASLRFTRKTGENDQLFGSVTTADIAEALASQGHKIDADSMDLQMALTEGLAAGPRE